MTLYFHICNNDVCLTSCHQNNSLIAMLSEQIIEEYLQQEHSNNEIKQKVKVSLLVISVIFLLLLSY